MRALVVGAAPSEDGTDLFYRRLADAADLVVAADAGASVLVAADVVPDLLVGDLDSLDPREAARLEEAGVETVRYPVEKDETDLLLAVEEARLRGATAVTLTAVSSGRLDHTLAAVGTLFHAWDLDAVLREPTFSAWPVGPPAPSTRTVSAPPGTFVSLLAPAGAEGVTLEGFRYPLHEAELTPLSGIGVSNVMEAGSARITIRRGTVLLTALHCADVLPEVL